MCKIWKCAGAFYLLDRIGLKCLVKTNCYSSSKFFAETPLQCFEKKPWYCKQQPIFRYLNKFVFIWLEETSICNVADAKLIENEKAIIKK